MKAITAVIAVAIALQMIHAYADFGYSANANITDDGRAKVTERIVLAFDTLEERKLFEENLKLGKTTINDWKNFSSRVGFHFLGPVENLRITANREFGLGQSFGSITIEYDINKSIVNSVKIGSRKTLYSFDFGSLVLDTSKTGEKILGSSSELIIHVPSDAVITGVQPAPITRERSFVQWVGPLSSKFELQYEREIGLSEEVSSFFTDSYNRTVSFLPLILLLAFSALLLFILVKFRKR